MQFDDMHIHISMYFEGKFDDDNDDDRKINSYAYNFPPCVISLYLVTHEM